MLDAIIAAGFDESYESESGGVRVRCSQCEASVINGHACHETGCPNKVRDDDDDDDYFDDDACENFEDRNT